MIVYTFVLIRFRFRQFSRVDKFYNLITQVVQDSLIFIEVGL